MVVTGEVGERALIRSKQALLVSRTPHDWTHRLGLKTESLQQQVRGAGCVMWGRGVEGGGCWSYIDLCCVVWCVVCNDEPQVMCENLIHSTRTHKHSNLDSTNTKIFKAAWIHCLVPQVTDTMKWNEMKKFFNNRRS